MYFFQIQQAPGPYFRKVGNSLLSMYLFYMLVTIKLRLIYFTDVYLCFHIYTILSEIRFCS